MEAQSWNERYDRSFDQGGDGLSGRENGRSFDQRNERSYDADYNRQQGEQYEQHRSQKHGNSPHIKIVENGPYIVFGDVPLTEDAIIPGADGHHMEYHRVRDIDTGSDGRYALCRCGKSKNKPFCDGTHEHVRFSGYETASKVPYQDRADVYPGPNLYLFDDNRCAYARFCHRREDDVWTLTEESADPHLKEEAIAASWHCPTGRLVHVDTHTRETYEDDFDPSIVILEDVEEEASGPYFVRGGIPLIGADGEEYELQNRYALCRCGMSANRPFCDASHISYRFDDGSEALQGRWGEEDDSFTKRPGTE